MNELEERVEAAVQLKLGDPAYLRGRLAEALDLNAELARDNERLAAGMKALEPARDFYERCAASGDWMEMAAAVKVLAFKGFGRNVTFALLRDRGILEGDNEPYQEYVNRGYFKTVEEAFSDSCGRDRVYRKTMVSQKGLDFIRRIIEEAAA
jgi:phage antirepressor YoqD-like protein